MRSAAAAEEGDRIRRVEPGHGISGRPTDSDYTLESQSVKAPAGSGVDVVEVPGRGHRVMLDDPEGFARATAAGSAR